MKRPTKIILMAFAVFVAAVGLGRAAAPAGHYSVTTSTVVDNGTGLEWERNAATSRPWADAITRCQSLSLDGNGWRLPSLKELQSIVDETESGSTLDQSAFSFSEASILWSSTLVAGTSTTVLVVNFYEAKTAQVTVTASHPSICVR